jgi:hypothetical protein
MIAHNGERKADTDPYHPLYVGASLPRRTTMLRRLPLALVLLSTIAVPATAQTAAEQRRFDDAQRRYDNESAIYDRERGYYNDALRRDGRPPLDDEDGPQSNDPNYNGPPPTGPGYNDPRNGNDPRYNNAPGYNGSNSSDPRYGGTYDDSRYATDYDASRDYRAEPNAQERRLSSNDKVYRGSDGRYYCKRSDGTTGLIVGAVAGGLLGNVIDGGRHRAGGTLLGGGLGALLGKSVDQQSSQYNCR